MIDRVTAGFGRVLSAALAAWALTGCSPTQQTQVNTALNSQPGQLFCRVQTSGGGAIIVAVVNAAAVGLSWPAAPIAGPAAVIATGASKAFVDQACADAAKALAAPAAVPIPPPPDPASAPKVAVPVPAA